MKNEILNGESAATGDKAECLCGFPLDTEESDCPSCNHRAGLEIYLKVKKGEPVTVLFTGVAASPVEIGGKWYWTIDKNFGDTEYDCGSLPISVTGKSLEELLNLGDLNAEETIKRLERFDLGFDTEEI